MPRRLRRTIPLGDNYDLLGTHFFSIGLLIHTLDALVARIVGYGEPGASGWVSEFGVPGSGVAEVAAPALIQVRYFFFRLTSGLTTTSFGTNDHVRLSRPL